MLFNLLQIHIGKRYGSISIFQFIVLEVGSTALISIERHARVWRVELFYWRAIERWLEAIYDG